MIAATVLALLFAVGRAQPLRCGRCSASGAALVTMFAMLEPYRRARLTSFLNPWDSAGDAGFQAVQGQIALGSGGVLGHGLGQSVQKIAYLPEAHTDFILAIIGEELGVLGVLALLILYAIVAWAGLRIAHGGQGPLRRRSSRPAARA